ncbi:imidazolonepropionase [Phyllobacterium sp. OV277]|uniref:imidazolonepropionase n=1 Tax=Phyllobacterium sp. OV277 TaxID=1882772 RepID=UPI001FCD2ED5|nr:imidazolonepropionase [Phyllobacterium sp. OV277]
MRKILSGLRIATLENTGAAYGLIDTGAIGIEGDRIAWVGETIPGEWKGVETQDFGGRLATPALIDCHTHLVFGGNRAREFEMRLEGASYEEIARAGGGIVSSVKSTNGLSEDELVAQSLPRLDTLLAEGISTVEIKSGYGLNIETELKMLRVARRLGTVRPVRIRTSYLAAHAVPPEYRGRADDYIGEVVLPGLDAAHAEGLVDTVDGFCEGIAFSPAQIARVFDRAKALGIPVKLHAEQLSNLGGAKLAASYGALSADHLEYLDEDGAKAMAAAGTVAVLLPGAFYALREERAPPVKALREAGARIAIATDCNPGTSPLTSLLLTMNMACTLFRLTAEEALAGATREAAHALGLQDDLGTIASGKRAEIAIWNATQPAELCYRIGFNPLHQLILKA